MKTEEKKTKSAHPQIDEDKKEILQSYFNSLPKEEKVNYLDYKCVNKIKPPPEIQYYNFSNPDDNDEYYFTDYDEFRTAIKNNPVILDIVVNNMDNIAFTKESMVKKKSAPKKPREHLDDDIEYDPPSHPRCNAMVWGGGLGGRCKYKCLGNGLCKSHYSEVYEKKRLLGYGYYNVIGNGSVPDYDAKKFELNNSNSDDNELCGKTEDIIKLRPLNRYIMNYHKEKYELNKEQFLEKYEPIIPTSQKDRFMKELDLCFECDLENEDNNVEETDDKIKEYNELKNSKKKLSKKKQERLNILEQELKSKK